MSGVYISSFQKYHISLIAACIHIVMNDSVLPFAKATVHGISKLNEK
jgi:hypothetical protein